MKCSACGKDNPADAVFCIKCGWKLSGVPDAGGQSGSPAAAQAAVVSTSGKAVAALIFGIVGAIPFPFLNLIFSVLAIVFGSLARSEIKKNRSLSGAGLATAGFILGLIDVVIAILILTAIALPNFIMYQSRARDSVAKSNMHRVQDVILDFSQQRYDLKYPQTPDDKTDRGETFSALLAQLGLNNPYTKGPAAVTFKGDIRRAPDESEFIDIPPGEIYVYSDGTDFLILAGDRRGESFSFRLSSGRP